MPGILHRGHPADAGSVGGSSRQLLRIGVAADESPFQKENVFGFRVPGFMVYRGVA